MNPVRDSHMRYMSFHGIIEIRNSFMNLVKKGLNLVKKSLNLVKRGLNL